MIRAVLHLTSEAAWTLVFKLAERRFPPEDDAPQPFDEAARARTRWMARHQRRQLYLSTRAAQREAAVDVALSWLSPREARLVREAAVMGYVQGAINGKHRDRIPPDTKVLREVVDACLAHSDLYPTINGGGS